MIKKMIAKFPDFWKLVKFGIVGVVNTGVDLGIYTLLIFTIPFFSDGPVFAKAISYTCGLINSFFMNRYFTFKSNIKLFSPRGLRFVIANLITLAISMGIIYAGTEFFELSKTIANIISIPVTLVINFVLNRLFVFNEK